MIRKANESTAYARWLNKILDAHRFETWNEQPTDAREREDDEMNDLWTELDESESHRLWGLSADLNTLRDREKWVDSDWPPMSEDELKLVQAEAFQAEEWDELLDNLRRPPRFRPRPTVDYMRGRAWLQMGHPEVALLFLDNATKLDSANAMYAELALGCLTAIQDWPEVVRRCDLYVQDSASPPRLLFRAAEALRAYADESGDERFYRESLRAVDEGFARSSRSNGPEHAAPLLAGAPAYATKGLCLLQLGEIEESLKVLDDAVAKFPYDTRFSFLRGAVRQELEDSDALSDFRKAVDGGSDIAWPYIELARDALQAGRNQDVVDLAYKGLERVGRVVDRAILFEFLAIASTRSQSSENFIQRAFQSAIELDPLNERIRSNSEMFERYMASPGAEEPAWQLAPSRPKVAIQSAYPRLQPAA